MISFQLALNDQNDTFEMHLFALNKCSLVKIDVERAEISVLRGAYLAFDRQVPLPTTVVYG